jgi:ssDNA-binding replication factor A large subunit
MSNCKIKDLELSKKNVNVEFIVLKVLETNTTKDNDKVYTYLVADETGSIEATVWNILFDIGDIIYFHDSYVSSFKSKKRLFVSGNGFVRRVGELKKEYRISEEHKKINYD